MWKTLPLLAALMSLAAPTAFSDQPQQAQTPAGQTPKTTQKVTSSLPGGSFKVNKSGGPATPQLMQSGATNEQVTPVSGKQAPPSDGGGSFKVNKSGGAATPQLTQSGAINEQPIPVPHKKAQPKPKK